MRLVFAGTPQAAVPALEALLASRHEVAAVVTRPDAASGRGLHQAPSPVALRAAGAGIEVLKPARVRDEEFLSRLRAIAPDCCPVTAYGALLPQTALDIPKHGWVNLHFSLLPAWRGAAPVQHAILHGDDLTGATTFQIVRELDAGPVYGVLTEPVGPRDTAGDLLGRLAVSGAGLLVATLDGIESGQLDARPQPAEGVSLAPKITIEDARVRWAEPALASGPADPGLHAGPGRVDHARRSQDQALAAGRATGPGRSRRPVSRGPAAGARGAAGAADVGAGRHGHRAGRAGRRPATGQAADARRGLGPRPAPDGRGAGLRWRPGVGRAAAASSVAISRPVVTSPVAPSEVASSAAARRRVRACSPRQPAAARRPSPPRRL